METTHGARKAAAELFGVSIDPARLDRRTIDTPRGPKSIEGIAAIIDDCTAAPELLRALRGLMECRCGHDVRPGECCGHVRAALAAIAKAEGRD